MSRSKDSRPPSELQGDPNFVTVRWMAERDVDAALGIVEEFDAGLVDEARHTFINDLRQRNEWPVRRSRLVALAGSDIVGTMGYGPGPLPSEGVYWTDWLMVRTDSRRLGIASRLYMKIEESLRSHGCRKVYLDVGTLWKQPAAVAFHSVHGYGIEGVLRDYWGTGEDLIVMAKELR